MCAEELMDSMGFRVNNVLWQPINCMEAGPPVNSSTAKEWEGDIRIQFKVETHTHTPTHPQNDNVNEIK